MKKLFSVLLPIFLISCNAYPNNQDQLKAKLVQDKRQQIDQKIEPYHAKSKIEESTYPFPTSRPIGKATLQIVDGDRSAIKDIPVLSVHPDAQMMELTVNLKNFEAGSQIYFYVDQNSKETEPTGNVSRTSVNLLGNDLDKGVHIVTAVQFKDDDVTQKVIHFAEAKYRVR